MILTVEDCIRVGLCTKGQMRFCRAHRINFRAFVDDGISFERLAGIEDVKLKRAMTQAELRAQAEAKLSE